MRLIDADSLESSGRFESMKNGDWEYVEVVYKDDIDGAPTIDIQQNWIPISERLPSEQENVIVTIYDDHGDTPWEYTANAWHIDGVWIADNDIVCGSVIAWMPLPTPYKKGNKI